MHPQLEQQIRLCIRGGELNPDLLVRLVDTSYREGDSRGHMLMDRLSDCVLVSDERDQIVEANPAARKLFKIPTGPLIGRRLQDFLPELQIDESLQQAQGALLAEHESTQCRNTIGKTFNGQVKLFVLKVGETGKRVCLIRKIDEANQVASPMATAGSKAPEKSSKTQDAFLAMMSHELRTPMNAVLGMTQHLLTTNLDEEQVESVKTIIDAGDVMMSLLNDLLDKSKIDAGKLTLETINVDLRHMIRKMERLWRPTIEEKDVAFIVRVGDKVPAVVLGDSIRIRQILSNLLSNAAKFTSNGSVSLEVDAKLQSDGKTRLEFAVRDTGVGMDEEVLARLFAVYEQANTATGRKFGGTGLGLSISKDLAEMMGGNIDVESRSGFGSVFRFHADFEVPTGLVETNEPAEPISKIASATELFKPTRAVVEAAKPAAPVAATPAPAPDDDSLRILAVEDNPINQRVLAAFLRPIGGDVMWAGDGQEALNILAESHFDVVLMDIQMPVMDGLEATRALRVGSCRNANIPIIAMTANAMLGDRETCLAAGMDDYVSKPIDPKTLYKSIARQVELARSGQRPDRTGSQQVA
ncbi:MAG: hypothetical protein COA47_09440 [Robiginitomaculum sp.]|nr:MAG: hypothetical protein COA47_09440 [Robiginitomaculum sp.]